MNTEFVTHRQWDTYATRIEREHLRKHGTSLTRGGIARRASAFILEVRGERMIVRTGWREAMKAETLQRAYVKVVIGPLNPASSNERTKSRERQ